MAYLINLVKFKISYYILLSIYIKHYIIRTPLESSEMALEKVLILNVYVDIGNILKRQIRAFTSLFKYFIIIFNFIKTHQIINISVCC